MDAITNWFKNSKEYYAGVAIYASLPTKKIRVLKALNRGKTRRNMATLVFELRSFKNTYQQPKVKPIVIEQPKVVTQEVINIEAERKHQITKRTEKEYDSIRIGDLPAELRPRYAKARNLFIEMIELKFALNDLPEKAMAAALKIQLQIHKLDEERDLIWNELHHWKQHKTLLPTTADDFKGFTERELDLKRRNFKSNKCKMQKRVDAWYNDLDQEKDMHQQILIEGKINRAEQKIHQFEINIKKIEALL